MNVYDNKVVWHIAMMYDMVWYSMVIVIKVLLVEYKIMGKNLDGTLEYGEWF